MLGIIGWENSSELFALETFEQIRPWTIELMQNAFQFGRVQSLTSVLVTVLYANLVDVPVKVTLILRVMHGWMLTTLYSASMFRIYALHHKISSPLPKHGLTQRVPIASGLALVVPLYMHQVQDQI